MPVDCRLIEAYTELACLRHVGRGFWLLFCCYGFILSAPNHQEAVMTATPEAALGTNHEYEPHPELLFRQEFSDFTGIARIMRGHVEELNRIPFRQGDHAGWLRVKTEESSRVVTAMARLQSAQAGSLRSLAQLRQGGRHVVIEHRRHIPPSRNEN